LQQSLLQYVRDSATHPTFLAAPDGTPIAFVTLRMHFPHAWEVHCIAVDAAPRPGPAG